MAGDNQVANQAYLEKNARALRAAFLHHPKREWLEAVNVYAQIRSLNINLEGCVRQAQRLLVKRDVKALVACDANGSVGSASSAHGLSCVLVPLKGRSNWVLSFGLALICGTLIYKRLKKF